jgi:hypothetical protein
MKHGERPTRAIARLEDLVLPRRPHELIHRDVSAAHPVARR